MDDSADVGEFLAANCRQMLENYYEHIGADVVIGVKKLSGDNAEVKLKTVDTQHFKFQIMMTEAIAKVSASVRALPVFRIFADVRWCGSGVFEKRGGDVYIHTHTHTQVRRKTTFVQDIVEKHRANDPDATETEDLLRSLKAETDERSKPYP